MKTDIQHDEKHYIQKIVMLWDNIRDKIKELKELEEKDLKFERDEIMSIIYEPKGRALEYSLLACNH